MRPTLQLSAIGMCLLLALSAPRPAAAQTVLYVDDDAAPGGDGTTWATAFNDLQDALAAAGGSGGAVTQLRAGGGIYTPDQASGERVTSFTLVSGLTISGGYAGLADPVDPDQRNLSLYESILSGDLARDDGPDFAHTDENSYHVLLADGTDYTAVLDGLTIAGGNASAVGGVNALGGGISIRGGSPTLIACCFRDNQGFAGAGLYCQEGQPVLRDCTFSHNLGASFGGAAYNYLQCQPAFIRCLFSANRADWQAGAVANADGCTGVFVSCTFVGNSSDFYGAGAILNNSSQPAFVNCVFSGNTSFSATFGGGAMRNENSTPTLINCTLYGNTASAGGGVLDYAGGTTTLANCLLWANVDAGGTGEGAQIASDGGSPIIDHCCIEGWSGLLGGNGNLGGNPYLVDPHGPDDLLGTPDDLLRVDNCGSSCADAGDNTALPPDQYDLDGDEDLGEPLPVDVAGNPRLHNDLVDIGAYETTPASQAVGDANCDGLVNSFDIDPFVLALSDADAWYAHYAGDCDYLCANDLNGDGRVNTFDIQAFVTLLAGP